MTRKQMTGEQIRKLIERDNKERLKRERAKFMEWWHEQEHRSSMSLLKAALEAWKARAGVKAPL